MQDFTELNYRHKNRRRDRALSRPSNHLTIEDTPSYPVGVSIRVRAQENSPVSSNRLAVPVPHA
jgi:hypothetical protein